MRFDILTLFPEMFTGPLTESILKRAQQAGLITIGLHNIRDYATDRHRVADDTPYGGGAGMVMKVDLLAAAIRAVLRESEQPNADESDTQFERDIKPSPPVILLTPDGQLFTQAIAEELAHVPRLVLVCGHYEGVDERLRTTLITRELSIGDYVLTGGELAAMVVVDAVARLVPGVLDPESIAEESHSDGLLEYPHYTRPALWEGQEVPPILLSGHHAEIAKWRRQQRLRRTLERRPDLLARSATQGLLTPGDLAFLALLGWRSAPEDEG
jgi:tRNA (guanine37-N1)-methyltransferase